MLYVSWENNKIVALPLKYCLHSHYPREAKWFNNSSNFESYETFQSFCPVRPSGRSITTPLLAHTGNYTDYWYQCSGPRSLHGGMAPSVGLPGPLDLRPHMLSYYNYISTENPRTLTNDILCLWSDHMLKRKQWRKSAFDFRQDMALWRKS